MKGLVEKVVNHTYRWRQRDIPRFTRNYEEIFSPPPDEPHTPLQYFSTFFTDDIFELIVENTNLYSVQKTAKSVCTTSDELKTFISMNMIIGIVQMPRY